MILSALKDQQHSEVLQKWVIQALNTWDSNCKPSRPVIIFTLKLVGLVASNELDFHRWQCHDVYNKLCTIIQPSNEDLPASIKIAYIQMLLDLIKHRSGREWILESGMLSLLLANYLSFFLLYIAISINLFYIQVSGKIL